MTPVITEVDFQLTSTNEVKEQNEPYQACPCWWKASGFDPSFMHAILDVRNEESSQRRLENRIKQKPRVAQPPV